MDTLRLFILVQGHFEERKLINSPMWKGSWLTVEAALEIFSMMLETVSRWLHE